MRCANGIVGADETMQSVKEKCGEPDERTTEPAAIDGNGALVPNAARIDHWTYGPRNGMYRHLRFVDGRLVETRSQRY